MSDYSPLRSSFYEGNRVPCVRYGYPIGPDNPRQEPFLRRLDSPIPTEATTASPVYLLDPSQFEQQQDLDNPYAVVDASCVATEIQDQCENTDDVIYPVYVESDAFPDVTFEDTIQHTIEFVDSCLDCPARDVTFYFSGNRSIHAHIPRVVTCEEDRDQLKKQAEEFCEETDASFDLGIYSRKRQFRLPGVLHEKTGLPKVKIRPKWGHDRIVRESVESDPHQPETYAQVLSEVFDVSVSDTSIQRTLVGNEEYALSFANCERDIPTPVIERDDPPLDPDQLESWAAYNRHLFSPYANAGHGERSIAVVDVLGGPFQRHKDGPTLVPVYFHAARSCNATFTKHREHAPLKLSVLDRQKWEYVQGDTVVVIGGKSRRSRIFRVSERIAQELSHNYLNRTSTSRQGALDFLQWEGYDTGKAGAVASTCSSSPSLVSDGGLTEAAMLKRRAERDGIQPLDHQELLNVANRLLYLGGWSAAWDWFQEQMGEQFNPAMTHRQLRSIVDRYPDLSHVNIPTKK